MGKGSSLPTEVRPRVIALVGPYSSGKTTLLENILFMTGQTRRQANGERVFGDDSPEAKALSMGTGINIASADFLGEPYIFVDCPGSVEFQQEAINALHGVDAAIIVSEPEVDKISALGPMMHELEAEGIPHLLFINKIDRAETHIRDMAHALETVSALPVVLRQVPIRDGDKIYGFVDLASRRAYEYASDGSHRIDMPDSLAEQVSGDRFEMLETIADFHDDLMEELLEDVDPPAEEVFTDLALDLSSNKIMSVMMGSATLSQGLTRLMKALRHEIKPFEAAKDRLNPTGQSGDGLYIMKTRQHSHLGKLSICRVIGGSSLDGEDFAGHKLGGMLAVKGGDFKKMKKAGPGDIIVLPRLEGVVTGDTLGLEGNRPHRLQPVFARSLFIKDQKDDARLSEALNKLVAEDPSYSVAYSEDTHELVLSGQGEMHMRAAGVALEEKYGVAVTMGEPKVPYKETIRGSKLQHTRFKKQSGGHGQYGDVVIEVRPLSLGAGFNFDDTVTGGAVPKQYIPSVENGVKEYLQSGPLGFPVVDVSVTLKDGGHHSVDSSDMAFKTAGRMAMSQAMPECNPVLLEPIEKVTVVAPQEYTAKITGLVSGRRGQILGFDSRDGWPGWEQLDAYMPKSEMQDLIIELRSLTQGAGTFMHAFDHMHEVTGKQREKALAQAG